MINPQLTAMLAFGAMCGLPLFILAALAWLEERTRHEEI